MPSSGTRVRQYVNAPTQSASTKITSHRRTPNEAARRATSRAESARKTRAWSGAAAGAGAGRGGGVAGGIFGGDCSGSAPRAGCGVVTGRGPRASATGHGHAIATCWARWHPARMTRRPAAVWSPRYACDIGAHVFPTAKYAATLRALVASGDLPEETAELEPPPASRELLAAAHDADYLDDLEALRWTPRTQYSELPLTREIVDAFALGASGTTEAARRALRQGATAHLGGGLHHAYAGHAEGFCYLNDLAVAARVLLREALVRRVAVVDLDVHQGNGTAHIFRDEPAVFTLSLHQENNYPTPKESGDLDVGLADGTGDEAYLAALRPALERV